MIDKTDIRYKCFNKIIEKLGTKRRSMKIDFLKSNLHDIIDGVFAKEQERYIFLNDIFRLLEEDHNIIKSQGSLTGLTEKGYEVYKMEDGFYSYLAKIEREQKEEILNRRLTIVNGISSLIAAIFAIASFIVAKLQLFPSQNNILINSLWLIVGFVIKELILFTTNLFVHKRKI